MKTRNGFVSNSSSASFIIIWCHTNPEPDDTASKIICQLMEVEYDPTTQMPAISTNSNLMDEAYNIAKRMCERTRKYKNDDRYITTDWTSMLNSPADFGTEIAKFALALLGSSFIKVCHSEIESD